MNVKPSLTIRNVVGVAIVLLGATSLSACSDSSGDDGTVAPTTVPPATTVPVPATTSPTTTEATTTTSSAPVAMVQVPDVVGMTEPNARAALAELGLEMTVAETYFKRTDAGTVRSQWPEPGIGAPTGSEIMVGIAVFPECVDWQAEPEPPATGEIQVTVLFECANDSQFPGDWDMVARNVPAASEEIEATLRALLDGPADAERTAGFQSFFDGDADALNWVMFDGGRLIVDFNEGIFVNNANTSTGGMFFMAELRANLFQFGLVQSIQFHIDGVCGVFEEWQQIGPECIDWTRAAWTADQARWAAERSG